MPVGVTEALENIGPVVEFRFDGGGSLGDAAKRIGTDLDRIVVGGGDGTLNLALPAVLQTGVPLGVIPLGTANDFVRSLNLPEDPVEAAELISRGHTQSVDVGKANGKPFLNAVGIGLGPELNNALDSETKQRLGVLAYLRGFVEVFHRRSRKGAILSLDGRRRKTRYLQITIANGVHYGGGMTIARQARLDDGELKVLCLYPLNAWRLLAQAVTLRRGPEPGEEETYGIKLYTAKKVEVHTRESHDVTADGELITQTPLCCESMPQALDVYVRPADGAGAMGSD